MTMAKEAQTCRVSQCENPAVYVCPRCRFPYCSVPCYRIHSHRCVQAFSESALLPLRGVTSSISHRKSFNDMLERLRDHPDDPHAESLIEYDEHTDNESDDVCESVDTQSVRKPDTTHSPDHSDDHHVLEELLNSLDEPGKGALFTVLNSAMTNAYTGTQSSPIGDYAVSSDPSRSLPESRNEDGATDITSTLEMLVEEMETSDLSYKDILVRLPDSLRSDFEQRLREGRFDRLLLVWTPWWQPAAPPEENSAVGKQPTAPLPPLPTSGQLVVPIHIPRQKASPCLQYNLIDMLAAYALSMRICNGEWWGDACAARTVWCISTVLAVDSRYTSVKEVCDAVAKSITREENHTLATQSLCDAADILSGGSDWVSRALYECQNLLESGLKVVGLSKDEIRKGIHKVGFFVSWSLCQESLVFHDIARKVIAFADLQKGQAEEIKIAARAVQASRTEGIRVLD